MAKSRLIGEYPVIGIRPIVDGRRGPIQRGLTKSIAQSAQKDIIHKAEYDGTMKEFFESFF